MAYLARTRNAERDVVMFLLSVRAGLRAKEIAGATWTMVMDSDGQISDVLALEDRVAKMRSGRTIPLSNDLKAALEVLHAKSAPEPFQRIIYSERRTVRCRDRGPAVFHIYARLGFTGMFQPRAPHIHHDLRAQNQPCRRQLEGCSDDGGARRFDHDLGLHRR